MLDTTITCTPNHSSSRRSRRGNVNINEHKNTSEILIQKKKINYQKFQRVSFVVHTSRAKKNPVKGLAPTVTYWDMAGGLFFIAALYPPILEAVFI